jgi:hypothetical protein
MGVLMDQSTVSSKESSMHVAKHPDVGEVPSLVTSYFARTGLRRRVARIIRDIAYDAVGHAADPPDSEDDVSELICAALSDPVGGIEAEDSFCPVLDHCRRQWSGQASFPSSSIVETARRS